MPPRNRDGATGRGACHGASGARRRVARFAVSFVAAVVLAASAGLVGTSPAAADDPGYALPVQLPAPVSSPPWDGRTIYTPTVISLLAQLEPAQTDPRHDTTVDPSTTIKQLANAGALLSGASPYSCTGPGRNHPPTGTTPAIAELCWANALGIHVTTGKQFKRTTALPLRLGMSSSFDTTLYDAVGQVEGAEGRVLGISGFYGPQVDIARWTGWYRNQTTNGEDPFVDATLGAAETNGIQGRGMLVQMKHFAFYNGQDVYTDAVFQDQAAHEIYLTPYEYGANGGKNPGLAASLMCSYQKYEVRPAPRVVKPAAGAWPPNPGPGTYTHSFGPSGGEYACQNGLELNTIARGMWGWQGFFASDWPATQSTNRALMNGLDQEMPGSHLFKADLVSAVKNGTGSPVISPVGLQPGDRPPPLPGGALPPARSPRRELQLPEPVEPDGDDRRLADPGSGGEQPAGPRQQAR